MSEWNWKYWMWIYIIWSSGLEDNIIYYPLKNSSKIGEISEIIEAKVAYYNWHMHVCNFNWSYEIFVILLLKILFDTLVGQNVYSLKPS